MNGSESPASPLETAAGSVDPRTTEAFERLGNEIRLAILLALWEAYEPFGDDDVVPFSDLRERVGVRDKGRFYYHLDRLVGQFVRRTEEGYALRSAGKTVVRAVIAGTGLGEATLAPTEIDKACPHCGSPVAITYENERLFQLCTECEGTVAESDELLAGTLTVWPFDQAGLADRTPTEMFVAGAVATVHQYGAMVAGVCPECTGPVDTTLDVCEDHSPGEGVCPTCGRRYPVQARFVCTVCKNKMWGPPSILAGVDPGVITFYADRGVDVGLGAADLDDVVRLLGVVREHDEAGLVSSAPPRVRVTFRCAGDELRLTLDGDLGVLDSEVVE